jgi:hypothetical protein
MTSDRMYNENASKNWLLKNYVCTLKDYWIRGVVYGALFQYEISSSGFDTLKTCKSAATATHCMPCSLRGRRYFYVQAAKIREAKEISYGLPKNRLPRRLHAMVLHVFIRIIIRRWSFDFRETAYYLRNFGCKIFNNDENFIYPRFKTTFKK